MKKLCLLLISISTIYSQQDWTNEETSAVEEVILFGAVDLMHNYLNTPTKQEQAILKIYFNECFPLLYDETISAKQAIEISKERLKGFSLSFPHELDEWASYPMKEIIELKSLIGLVGTEIELSENGEFYDMAYYYTMYSYLNGVDKEYRAKFNKVKKGKTFSILGFLGRISWINIKLTGIEESPENHQKKLEAKFDNKLYKSRSRYGSQDNVEDEESNLSL